MPSEDQFPLARLQVHALRVVTETAIASGQQTVELPARDFEKVVAMLESCRTPGCKRCGVDLALTPDAKYVLHPKGYDEYGRVMRFCTIQCMKEWDSIEDPSARYVARAYFSGHAVIDLDLLHRTADQLNSCNEELPETVRLEGAISED